MEREPNIAPIPRMLLDREGMAAAISVCSATLDLMRKQPGFPEVRIPGSSKRLFNPARVVEWLEAQSTPAEDTQTLAAAKAKADIVFGSRRAI